MADAITETNASCGDRTMTDQDCSVSMQGDCEDVIEKVAHKNSALPNGCLKHTLEENGRVKLVENNGNNARTIHEGLIDSSKPGDSFFNCDHVSETGMGDSKDICVNTLEQKQNGTEVPGQLANECDNNSLSDEIANLSVVDDALESPEQQTESGVCEGDNEEGNASDKVGDLEYVVYESELQMPDIMRLITKDLSEPYSIYTYRYFIHNWPRLCFLAMDRGKCVGAIVCKHDLHKKMVRRGYIAMLAVDQNYRRRGIGSHLVMKAIRAMVADECDEVVLETEITNKAALRLYENLGFLRDKRLFRYYLNGVDALRLKLWLR